MAGISTLKGKRNHILSDLKRMCEATGIHGNKTDHSILNWLHAGVPPTLIQQPRGHKNIASIAKYATASAEQQKQMTEILMKHQMNLLFKHWQHHNKTHSKTHHFVPTATHLAKVPIATHLWIQPIYRHVEDLCSRASMDEQSISIRVWSQCKNNHYIN